MPAGPHGERSRRPSGRGVRRRQNAAHTKHVSLLGDHRAAIVHLAGGPAAGALFRAVLNISRTATQSCSISRCDELATIKVTIHDHEQVVPQREGSKSWRSTLIILLSISLSFIFVFHRALPSCFRGFLIPSFSNATAQVPSDTTFPAPTSPAAFSSNGRTDQVQWDNYTLVLRGQRVLI